METFGRLHLDRAAERDAGVLRLGAAVITLGGVAWLATMRLPLYLTVLALAAVAVSLVWVGLYFRARRRLRAADDHYLETSASGIKLASGSTAREVRWEAVEAVEVDEDRLLVRVETEDGEPLLIEPIYGGLGVYELHELVRRARESQVVQSGEEVRTIGAPDHE